MRIKKNILKFWECFRNPAKSQGEVRKVRVNLERAEIKKYTANDIR
jgi:hypothetical protein